MQKVDHQGNVFPSKQAMCKAYEIPVGTFNDRMKKNWTLEEALTTRPGEIVFKPNKPCTDHLGNEYASLGDKCEQYGVPMSTYCSRIKRGYEEKEALLGKKEYDHLGQEFDSKLEMCVFWDVPVSTFDKRKNSGCSLEECLTGKRRE